MSDLHPRHATTQYLFTTVPVETVDRDGARGLGTAFFFEMLDEGGEPAYLITNKHVIAGAARAHLCLHTATAGRRAKRLLLGTTESLTIDEPESVWLDHPDPEVDLCALSVAQLQALAGGKLDNLFFRSMSAAGIPTPEEESGYPAVLRVAMIGYPIGLWDKQNNLPVIRTGNTASHPAVDFDGRPEVMIDMACFPGSSGSPVVFDDRPYFAGAYRFLGVLSRGPLFTDEGQIVVRDIPTRREAVAINRQLVHLGYVIKAREIRNLLNSVRSVSS